MINTAGKFKGINDEMDYRRGKTREQLDREDFKTPLIHYLYYGLAILGFILLIALIVKLANDTNTPSKTRDNTWIVKIKEKGSLDSDTRKEITIEYLKDKIINSNVTDIQYIEIHWINDNEVDSCIVWD